MNKTGVLASMALDSTTVIDLQGILILHRMSTAPDDTILDRIQLLGDRPRAVCIVLARTGYSLVPGYSLIILSLTWI